MLECIIKILDVADAIGLTGEWRLTVSVLLLMVLFLGLVVPVGIVVALLVQRSRGSANADDGAVCGKCGYSTRGLPGLDCPECGSDLREVGIVLPQKAGPKIWVWFVLAGGIAMVLLVCLGGLIFSVRSAPVTVTTVRRTPVVTTVPMPVDPSQERPLEESEDLSALDESESPDSKAPISDPGD